jgi:eukaryotic-like serine/threonine-protein kinase
MAPWYGEWPKHPSGGIFDNTHPGAPLHDQRESLQARLVDRYRIDRELGRGGMATVYLAHDLRHDRPVALKVLHVELALNLGAERFQREIKLAARLQHPHILTVHDSGEIPGEGGTPAILWFTMPFIEGETLRTRLLREGQLPVQDAVRIIREAADALGYAHSHGVIHRDLKPENILLTSEHAMVADFGIARALGGGADRLTGTGFAIGTPAYMSPEQAAGSLQVDSRSDIYALGCVLYEMLAGEPPFTGPTPMAIAARSMSETPRPLHQVRETIPAAIDHVVSTALAKAPADRYATALQFAQALAPELVSQAVTRPTFAPMHQQSDAALARLRRLVLGHPLFAVLMLGMVIGSGVLFAWGDKDRPVDANRGKLLAVLPFENVGPPNQEYFVDGVTDEIRGRLTGLTALRVTARSSSSQYKHTGKSPQELGRELGVDYLLTGTVRWDKGGGAGRVKVSPELIVVSSGSAKWQQSFDASLSDVFEVQADIAARVAQALDVALSEGARAQLNDKPTANVDAYDDYLKAQAYEQRARLNVEPQTMVIARQLYERAIAADSGFGLAWARLAQVTVYQLFRDPADSGSRSVAKLAVVRALALAPRSAEAHIASGDYASRVDHDNARATAEYETALRLQPSNAEVLTSLAYSQWSRGAKDSSLANMRRASALDPRSAERALGLARAYSGLRRFAEADSSYDLAIALAPDQYHAYFEKASNLIAWRGDVKAARQVMKQAEVRIGKEEFVRKMCLACFDWGGPLAADYERVLDQLTLEGFSPRDSANYYMARAQRANMHDLANLQRIYWDSARVVTERMARADLESGYSQELLGLIYAGLGRAAKVKQSMNRAEALYRAQGDTAWLRPVMQVEWAMNLVLLGQRAAAADSLAAALADSTYPYLTVAAVQVDPFWARLRGIPRFDRLLATK